MNKDETAVLARRICDAEERLWLTLRWGESLSDAEIAVATGTKQETITRRLGALENALKREFDKG